MTSRHPSASTRALLSGVLGFCILTAGFIVAAAIGLFTECRTERLPHRTALTVGGSLQQPQAYPQRAAAAPFARLHPPEDVP